MATVSPFARSGSRGTLASLFRDILFSLPDSLSSDDTSAVEGSGFPSDELSRDAKRAMPDADSAFPPSSTSAPRSADTFARPFEILFPDGASGHAGSAFPHDESSPNSNGAMSGAGFDIAHSPTPDSRSGAERRASRLPVFGGITPRSPMTRPPPERSA